MPPFLTCYSTRPETRLDLVTWASFTAVNVGRSVTVQMTEEWRGKGSNYNPEWEEKEVLLHPPWEKSFKGIFGSVVGSDISGEQALHLKVVGHQTHCEDKRTVTASHSNCHYLYGAFMIFVEFCLHQHMVFVITSSVEWYPINKDILHTGYYVVHIIVTLSCI